MCAIHLIRHSEASPEIIDQVIAAKQVAWPYPKESQLNWINENLNQEDIHVFLRDNEENVAYLNLVQIHVQINGKKYEGYGVGNVCSKKKNKGYGNKLIRLTNDYLKANDRVGLLFCHTPLIQFYSRCSWVLLPLEKCISPKMDEGIYAMTFNAPDIIDSLKYKEKLF